MELIDKCYEYLFWGVLAALAVCVVVALVYIFRSKLTVDRIIGINHDGLAVNIRILKNCPCDNGFDLPLDMTLHRSCTEHRINTAFNDTVFGGSCHLKVNILGCESFFQLVQELISNLLQA